MFGSPARSALRLGAATAAVGGAVLAASGLLTVGAAQAAGPTDTASPSASAPASDSPSATPTSPSATPTSPSATPTVSATPTASATPTVSATPTGSATPTVSAGAPSPSASAACVTRYRYRQHLSHTWDGTTAVITLSGANPLCVALDVEGVSWTYTSSTAVFPQTFYAASGVVRVRLPGTYTVSAPASCGQRDIYATVGQAPQFPGSLTGPHAPYEPEFLNQFSTGPITFRADSPGSCAPVIVVPPATPPPVVTPVPTATVLPTRITNTPVPTTTATTTGTATTTPRPTATVLPTFIRNSTSPKPSLTRTGHPTPSRTANVLPTRITRPPTGTATVLPTVITNAPGTLPRTGGFSGDAGVAGLVLLGAGGLTVAAARRRHR